MDIKTLGENLAKLNDAINTENNIGESAMNEMLKIIDGAIAQMEAAKIGITQHMQSRKIALDAVIVKPNPINQENNQ